MITLRLGDRDLEPQRIFCIGRNYAAHVEELANERPGSPVVFMKPPHCLVPVGTPLTLPNRAGAVHHEVELVLLIGRSGRPADIDDAWDFVAGVSLGLDLTLRDLQADLKARGLPWEPAKAFESSAPVGEFVPVESIPDRDRILFDCTVRGELRQRGDTGLMLFGVPTLLVELGRTWSLLPGDLVFTGTPAGVGPIESGDRIEISSPAIGHFSWTVR